MKKFFALAVCMAAIQSCSLLKFSVDMGDEPIPATDVNTRVMVRAFYRDFSAGIINAADSIVSLSPDLDTKIRAMRWKMDATSICAGTAYGSLPEMSLFTHGCFAILWTCICPRLPIACFSELKVTWRAKYQQI